MGVVLNVCHVGADGCPVGDIAHFVKCDIKWQKPSLKIKEGDCESP